MSTTLRNVIFMCCITLLPVVTQAQSGRLDGAYLCGIDGSCVYTPLIAERYELVVSAECGAWHDQLKADNPNIVTFLYTSGTDNYTTPSSAESGWYFGPREHAWLKRRCQELGYSPEILYVHYYEDTEVSGHFIPGTYSTTITDADSVSRTPVYLGYYSGSGIGRILVNFSHPITRQLQIEYAKKAWTDPNAGTDWPQSSTWDGLYLDNWMANELHPGMGQIGVVASGGRLAEHPTLAVIGSTESINWYQQAEHQFARALRDTLHNAAAWSPDGKAKYLAANIANSWIDDFYNPNIAGLDYLLQEYQYNPVRSYSSQVRDAYRRDSACYANGVHTLYCALQTTTPSSGSGTLTTGEAMLGNLAWYYVTRSANTYMYQMHANPSNYWIDVGATNWDAITWSGCMEFDVGTAVGKYTTFATGTDPVGWSYTIYQREYSNALVFLRARGQWNEDVTPQTAVTINLPTAYRQLLPDGTQGPLTTTFSLKNGCGLILVKQGGGQTQISPPSPVSPANGAYVQTLQPTLTVNNAYDPESRSLRYEFQLDANGDFIGTDLIVSQSGQVTSPSPTTRAWAVPQALLDGWPYYWRSRVVTTSGDLDSSSWCTTYGFTVALPGPNNCPGLPTLSSPANGSQTPDNTPTLTITNAVDIDGDVLTYDLQVGTSAAMTTIVASTAGQAQGSGTTSWTVNTTLNDGQTYYWRARSNDGECTGNWTGVYSFGISVENQPPPGPVGAFPVDGDTIGLGGLILTVNNVVDPEGNDVTFQFLLYRNGQLVDYNTTVPQSGGSTTSWSPSVAPQVGVMYTWRAQSRDAYAYGGWSPVYAFCCANQVENQAPPAPQPYTPQDGDTIIGQSVILEINNVIDPDGDAVTYDFEVYADAGLTNLVVSAGQRPPGVTRTSWPASFTPGQGASYWWRARAADAELSGAWSQVQDFMIATVTASVPPTAEFSGSPLSGAAPLNVNFTDASTDYPTSWLWNFGDGVTSTAQNPSHTYSAPGTYAVSLTATNSAGSDMRTKTAYITVACVPPQAGFSSSSTTGEVPLTVSFADQSSGATSWLWNFGDGTTSGVQNPSHQYTQVGTYTVSLVVTNSCGVDTLIKSGLISVVCTAPVAAFAASVEAGELPLAVSFTDQSAGATAWSWDFGDESFSTEQHPGHTYTAAGTYTVTLTATNQCGSSMVTRQDLITVTCTKPVAGFAASKSSGELPLAVQFTDQSIGATSWLWSFGDGAVSTVQHPQHTYTAAGAYTVTLIVANMCGVDTLVGPAPITVTCTAPVAGFTSSPNAGEMPLAVQFTDQSSGATSWAWNFGDSAGSTEQNPSHTYTAVGTYTVHLTVANQCGQDVITKNGLVTVTCELPAAQFNHSVSSGEQPLTVHFTDLSTAAASWAWDFGDGNTSTLQNPGHTYVQAGTYGVTLIVTNQCGADTVTKGNLITVTCTAPSADFTGGPTTGTLPLDVSFTNLSSGADSWLWDFGDGTTSTQENPSHTYDAVGSYTVTLTAANGCGSVTATKQDFITVSSCLLPVAGFTATELQGDYQLTVNFTNTSTGATGRQWNFGDGTGSSIEHPSHTYPTAGVYTVSLIVYNDCGADTFICTDCVIVNCPLPVANFSTTKTSGPAPFIVDFSNLSVNGVDYLWDFGDGSTSTEQSPTHVYTIAGTFTVSLHVENPCGSDDEIRTGLIEITQAKTQAMHVNAIRVEVGTWWVFYSARAFVQMVDEVGQPVKGATVYGEWISDAGGSVSFKTDADGWGSVRSKWRWVDGQFKFCVSNVVNPGWGYDASANEMTCATAGGGEYLIDETEIDMDEIEAAVGRPLAQNYPNPFNPETKISYFVPEDGVVAIDVYNALGQHVCNLLEEYVPAGVHTISWAGADQQGRPVATGLYFYRVDFDRRASVTRKMVLMK